MTIYLAYTETDEAGVSIELYTKKQDALDFVRKKFDEFKSSTMSDEEYFKSVKDRHGKACKEDDSISVWWEGLFGEAFFYGWVEEKTIK